MTHAPPPPVQGGLAVAVRKLHAPVHDGTWQVCEGCDTDNRAPMWPCGTARLVYTPEEIAAVPDRLHGDLDPPAAPTGEPEVGHFAGDGCSPFPPFQSGIHGDEWVTMHAAPAPSGETAERAADVRLAKIADAHREWVRLGGLPSGECIACGDPWPCVTYRWATVDPATVDANSTWDMESPGDWPADGYAFSCAQCRESGDGYTLREVQSLAAFCRTMRHRITLAHPTWARRCER